MAAEHPKQERAGFLKRLMGVGNSEISRIQGEKMPEQAPRYGGRSHRLQYASCSVLAHGEVNRFEATGEPASIPRPSCPATRPLTPPKDATNAADRFAL